jgi:putative flippase GtrA
MATSNRFSARQLLFVCVGACCFLVQFGVLTALTAEGVYRPLANAIGFAISVQLNFAVSFKLTWRDRPAGTSRTAWARLLTYNATALLSLAINTVVFTITHHSVGNLLAFVFGVSCGMCVTYLACDLLIFRDRRKRAPAGRPPRWGPTRLPPPVGNVAHHGISIVMPAYREEENLAATVANFLEVPESLEIPHCVVVVDDGSNDRTGEIAERLAAQNPGRVVAIHHDVNRGYGAAVSTGIATALALDHRWLFLTDSDGQFRARQMPTFLDAARRERADAVVGFRPHRADPWYRKVEAFLWTSASRILLPVRVRDVDCSYKLIDRWCLEGLVLKGAAATISPELIAKLSVKHARIIERPVDHFPRLHGEQTGAKLSVIIRSLMCLLTLSAEMAAARVQALVSRTIKTPEGLRENAKKVRTAETEQTRRAAGTAAIKALGQPADARRARRVSPEITIVAAVACTLSIAAYLHFYPHGQTIAYKDAESHLLIARRVIFADTPGVAQLGGVWLPLPHILMLPLIWNNWSYYSGFAGSVVMMLAYVVCAVFIYKFIWHLTHRHWAAACGTAVFALNPNVLYMQSTPMTELLMFATMMGAVYGLLRWIQTDDGDQSHHLYLLGAGLSAMLCALTRYEGWTLAVTLAGVVVYGSLTRLPLTARLLITASVTGSFVLIGWGLAHFGLVALALAPATLFGYIGLKRLYARNDWDMTEGQLIAFGILGVTGPIAWMIWNWTIFGNPFAFQNGPYAKPSLWVGSGEKAVHNIVISLHIYEIATVDNLTPAITILAVTGLIVYLWSTRLSAESLPALALLSMLPLFVVTLYKGERPLHVYPYYSSYYNVRFGLVMILPACLMIGFLAAVLAEVIGKRFRSRRWGPLRTAPSIAGILAVVLIAAGALQSGDIVTLIEPMQYRLTLTAQHQQAAAQWLRTHYTGGLLLMESYGNEDIAFDSRVPTQDQVYEGSYRVWQPALANPSGHDIAWIVMCTDQYEDDQVYKHLYGSTRMDNYRLVWRNDDLIIYASKQAAAQMASRQLTASSGAPNRP